METPVNAGVEDLLKAIRPPGYKGEVYDLAGGTVTHYLYVAGFGISDILDGIEIRSVTDIGTADSTVKVGRYRAGTLDNDYFLAETTLNYTGASHFQAGEKLSTEDATLSFPGTADTEAKRTLEPGDVVTVTYTRGASGTGIVAVIPKIRHSSGADQPVTRSS